MKVALPLTELKIKNLAPKQNRYKVFDGNGLYIEVLPSGKKSWRLKYQINGKDKRQSFGYWPLVNLKNARELADKFRLKLKNGWEEEQKEKQITTFAELAKEWGAKFFLSLSSKAIKSKKSLLDRLILPFIGHINVLELNSNLILTNVLQPIDERKQSETLLRTKILLSQIFRYGAAMGKIDRDFTQDYKGFFAPSVVVHRATILDKTKIGKLIQDIRTYTGSKAVSYALNILPYVFVRPGELRHAEWTEIDFQDKLWRIPAGKMKMRSQHVVPLSNQVVALLQNLQKCTGDGKYLFPGLRNKTRPISDMAINAALRYLGYGKEEICGHGFRSMASTLLNEKGYRADLIERQLAHTQQNSVRAVYNHAEYLPERRKMMQEWADYLDHLAEEAKRN